MVAAATVDAGEIQECLRLGWCVAEIRGRHRSIGDVADSSIRRADNAMPLANERSTAERAIEVESAVRWLADALKLNVPVATFVHSGPQQAAGDQLRELAQAHSAATENEKQTAYHRLTEFLYQWDAWIQDTLAAAGPNLIAAYRLGRGLSEVRWQLDPTVTVANDTRSWQFLLGAGRRDELGQHLDSLSGYVSPLTVGVIERSLQKWGDIAADPTRRTQSDAMTALAAQAMVWHDLLVSARPAETLIDRSKPLAVVRSLGPLLRALWPQILLGLLFVIALCAGAWLLTSVASWRGAGAALAVLGAFGVSATTVSAKTKDEANRLVERLRTAYQLEAAAEAGIKLPASNLPSPKRKLGIIGRRFPQKRT
jgi:hypothetical protein